MKFGSYPVQEAVGLLLAHSIALPGGKLPKGHVVTPSDAVRLSDAGFLQIVGVRMDDGDLTEDEAASKIAEALSAKHLSFSSASTGRVNIFSDVDGVFVADKSCVDQFNGIDPTITLACLADHSRVQAGDMIATLKIIPLAVPASKVDQVCTLLSIASAFTVKPFCRYVVSLIATELPTLKTTVMEKTARILDNRLAISGNRLHEERRVPHEPEPLAREITTVIAMAHSTPKLIIIFGASAVSDDEDVVPEAIRKAGGKVLRVGMPVDPGNLIVLGCVGGAYVIGAPGCARSSKENGFDWILDRVVAGENPTAVDVVSMGVGGLLMEIENRPRPRETPQLSKGGKSVSIILLAAGRSSRMGEGGFHKLLAEFDGVPLIRRLAMVALSVDAASVTVVVGHRRGEIMDALDGLAINSVENLAYKSGMSSSLIAGLKSKNVREADGVLVMLADMPHISHVDLDSLISAFRSSSGAAIVRAASGGKRGNPVILPRQLFSHVMRLEGDVGARQIIESSGLPVIEVEIGKAAITDVNTAEDVSSARGRLTK